MFLIKNPFINIILLVSLMNSFVLGNENNESKKVMNIQDKDMKLIMGEIETVKVSPPELSFEARIDTGATTTSIDARDITAFERDGKKWVKFTMVKKKKEYPLERPVIKITSIKRHGKKAQERFVVKMQIAAGDTVRLINVTLADRSEYEFPILIGRNFLKDYFVVDVSNKHILKKTVK